jgi:hypothetical protein
MVSYRAEFISAKNIIRRHGRAERISATLFRLKGLGDGRIIISSSPYGNFSEHGEREGEAPTGIAGGEARIWLCQSERGVWGHRRSDCTARAPTGNGSDASPCQQETRMIKAADLKTVPFFQELSEDELKKLAQVMEERTFKKGEIIFNEGEEGKALYLLAEGEVEVVKTMKGWYKETLAVFKKGRLFGELSFLSGKNHSALARATQDVKVYVLTRNQYDRLEKNDPVVTQKIMKVIALTLSTALQKMNERFLHMVNYILGEESGA